MANHNSLPVDFYTGLLVQLHVDVAHLLNVCDRTLKYERREIAARVSREGIAFLTKTLPSLGKAFDKALATNTPFCPVGFQKPAGSVLPKFFGWLLKGIFDTNGLELENSNPEYVKHFRQLTYLVYKLELPFKDQDEKFVIDNFKRVDRELEGYVCTIETDPVLKYARNFVTSVFGTFDELDIIPSHGKGSVASGEDNREKSKFSRLYLNLEQKYPFTEYFYFNLQHVADEPPYQRATVKILGHSTAKVVLVPKDSRGPRLISCEPLEMMWIQQGLGRKVMTHLESHPLTRGHVNFTSQQINRDLALAGSVSSEWVTLDMKEASDRVSMQLINQLFSDVPGLLDALRATRSTHTRLPDGTTMALNKFAPMGSSLCFPIESFVFYALIVSALVTHCHYSRRKARAAVFVYGDDIIMREEDYLIALRALPLYGLMFNQSKCCVAGFFRESCGCDAYKGVDVTPIRLRTTWCDRYVNSPSVLTAYAEFSNYAYARKYVGVADYVRFRLESIYGRIPYSDSPILARKVKREYQGPSGVAFYANHAPLASLNQGIPRRWNNDGMYSLEFQSYGIYHKKVEALYDGYQEMLRRLSDGLERQLGLYAVRHRSRLQRRWINLGHC